MPTTECVSHFWFHFTNLALDALTLWIKNAVCLAQVILDNWTQVQMDIMGSLDTAKKWISMQIF